MTNIEKAIYNKLERLFKENNWMPITIDMTATGLPIELSIISYIEPKKLSDVDLIVAEGPQSAAMFTGKVKTVVNKLANYMTIHNQWIDDFTTCKLYFDKYIVNHPSEYITTRDERWRVFEKLYYNIFNSKPIRNGIIFDRYFDYDAYINGKPQPKN